MRSARQEALNRLKQAKTGETSRVDQYKVKESDDLIINMDESEYKKHVQQRKKEQFIVDDLGIGYDDEGEFDLENDSEEFEEQEPEPVEQKANPSIKGFLKNEVIKKPRLLPTAQKEIRENMRKDFLSMLDDEDFDAEKLMKVTAEPIKKQVTIKKGESDESFKKNYDITIASLKKNMPEKVEIKNPSSENLKRAAPGYPHLSNNEVEDKSHDNSTAASVKFENPFSSKGKISRNSVSAVTNQSESLKVSELASPASFQDKIQELPLPEPTPDLPMELDIQDSNLEEKLESMEIETSNIETLAIENNPEIPLENGILRMFWIDAIEDKELMPGKIFLFGKVYLPQSNRFTGVCVLISEVKRRLFVLPRPEFQENFEEIHSELEAARKSSRIRKWAIDIKPMKYAFEVPEVPPEANYIEIEYSSLFPPLISKPFRTVQHIFNANCSLVENLLIHKKMKGPCWLLIKNASQPKQKISNCRIELVINSYDDLEVEVLGSNNPPPPLSIIALSLKTVQSKKGETEIFAIGLKVHQKVDLHSATEDISQQMASFSIINSGKDEKTNNFETVRNEKVLIERFLDRLSMIDPDILIAHEMFSDFSEKLLTRLLHLRPSNLSELGRIFRKKPPISRKEELFTGNWQFRGLTAGRLLLDTEMSSKELSREKNYSLKDLSKNWFNVDLPEIDFDPNELFKDSLNVKKLSVILQAEVNAVYCIIKHLNIIPLSRELTNIAGNLWIRSLQNQRAERNEMLLIHEFFRRGFVYPDRSEFKFEEKGEKKKNQFLGGKVLDPVSGLYDKFVILLDFNSLYPSIIREYNICFTTVQRRKEAKEKDSNDPGTIIEGSSPGVLPDIITTLVNQRRQVKNAMKGEQNKNRLKQLDIRQTALKLTANSMYGCLGFKASRFYARAIAALITQIGRNTLERTVKLAKDSLSLEVIYGDTDSIMIHTGLDDIQAAVKKGEELKHLVNKQFKKLEIELDGVFRSMLLLKKKKYAALKVENNGNVKREVKGLDMVRRDWCDLSRRISEKVLDIVLSGELKDEISEKIKNCVDEFYKGIEQCKLSEFIITKQLTKTVDKYKDAQNQPHVQVAIRLQSKQNKSCFKHFIPYVICEGDGPIAMRAYHPEEIASSNSTLAIDKKWYITQQIIPPLSRLIEPISLIKIEEIVEILGENPSKYKQNVVKKVTDNKNALEIMSKCQVKDHESYDLSKCEDSLNCPKCAPAKLTENYVSNAIVMHLKMQLKKVYSCEYKCNKFGCSRVTKRKSVRECNKNGCQGEIMPFPSIGLLVNEIDRCADFTKKYWDKGHQLIKQVYAMSGYKTVDLSAIKLKAPNYKKLLY
jgi:DNA polymerase alpha subunit A